MTTTIIIVFIIEAPLCILLFMKGCMFCKYTPATLKKELKDPDFLSRIIRQSVILYDRRLPQLNVFFFNQLGNFTIHVISDQFTDRRGEVKIHGVKVFRYKTV